MFCTYIFSLQDSLMPSYFEYALLYMLQQIDVMHQNPIVLFAMRTSDRAILLKIVLHKFTNPKIRNQCCNMFEHVFHSVLLHLPYILLETTSIFTLGFSSLILWNLIFHWWHKEKMCFLKPLCVSRTYWHMKVFSIMTNEYSFEMKHFAGL